MSQPMPPGGEKPRGRFHSRNCIDLVLEGPSEPPAPAPPSLIRLLERERAKMLRWKDWKPGMPIPPEEDEPGPAKPQ